MHMNVKFFSKELRGRVVEDISGGTIGILEDVVLDVVSGRIKYLLIRPTSQVINRKSKVDEYGRLVVSTGRILLEGERMVIN